MGDPSADNRDILGLVYTGRTGLGVGYILEEAASLLLQAGAHNGLLMDAGNDVFLKVGGVMGN